MSKLYIVKLKVRGISDAYFYNIQRAG